MYINLNENKKKLQFAIIGAILIIAAVLIIPTFFFKKQKPMASASPSPITVQKLVPTKQESQNIPANIKAIKQKIVDSKEGEDNGDIIIKKTEAFKVIYLPARESFLVFITKDPADKSKSNAEKFFTSFGLKQTDLCTLPVRFVIDFSLKAKNPAFNPLPNGCN